MRLRRNQFCPIQHSRFCCGRGSNAEGAKITAYGCSPDRGSASSSPLPRIRSNAEMRRPMNQKIAVQGGKCALCDEKFTDYDNVVPDHIM